MIFHRCELHILPAPPVFSRLEQSSTNALILKSVACRDLADVAVGYFSVHWVRRLFESGVDESDDLTAELCDKSDAASSRVRRMLPPLPVACRYRLNCGVRIAFRIKAGVILSTIEERAGDSVSIS